jgi:DNA primase small subunit
MGNETEPSELLRQYYEAICPFTLLERLYGADNKFAHREFSFERYQHGKAHFCRNEWFRDAAYMKSKFIEKVPFNVTNGAVYNEAPGTIPKESRKHELKEAELAFDIDMDKYDHLRQCCKGKEVCSLCWGEFAVPAMGLIEETLRRKLMLYKTLWTFSGSRGVHCRVFDHAAR